MLLLLISSVAAAGATPASATLEQCRAAITRKTEGEVSALTMTSSKRKGTTTTIRGTVTVLVGMGEPGRERAKAHHLIRQQLTYACSLRGKSVRKLTFANAD